MTSKKTTLFFKTGMLAAMLMAWPAASAPTIGDAPYGQARTADRHTRLPLATEPVMDYWMRDTWMTLGPDGYYYMTGTTADPTRVFPGQTHCWDWNDGIYVFRSKDMKEWTPLGRVWSLDDNGTWQREAKVFGEDERYPKRSLNGDVMDNRFRAVWAPELHYLKSQKCWFIVACMNNSKTGGKGSFVLRSTSGGPEGPYVNIKDNEEGPLFDNIDGSLFEDEDGTVYFVGHNHYIARMKADMSGLDEPLRRMQETAYHPEPYIEGAFICKEGGRYHLVQAIWSHRLDDGTATYCPAVDDNRTRYSYDCIIASADNIYGPYSPRYNAITGGGHNNLFRDKQGQWWATIFFNPRGAQAKEYKQTCRPGVVPMKFRKGRFAIDYKRVTKKKHNNMKTNKCFTAVVLTALMATGIQAQNHSVTITTAKAKKVSRMIYGWHYEEIGNIGEGGLYAEMVRNRGFEEANLPGGLVIENGQYKDVPNPGHPNKRVYQIDPLVGWVTTPLSNSPIRITCTDRHPLNDQNPHSMAVNVISNDLGRAAIHNQGYNGMAFKQGVACRLSFYARSEGYEGTVAFRLSDEEGRAVSEAKSFTIGKGQWTKYECELVPTKNIAAGMLTIVPSQRGRFQLDMVSMFPSDTYDGGRSVFRADVLQNLIDYRPHFLRFPGGCIVHGVNEETMYHWKKTIGDIAQRPGQWCKWEPHYRTDGLGYHEFYELCEYMGCDAMYVTPTGMACTEWVHRDDQRHFFHKETDVNYYINDLLDAIEYAIGPVDSRWGAERAKNGHPEPFPLKYVEIGNEDFGPVYYEKYHQIYSAVKQRYPQLRFIANSPLGTEGEKERFMDEFIDRSEVEIYDEHYYKGIPWAVKNFHKYDVYKRRGIDIFIGELGIQSNGVGGPSGRYPGSILAEGIFKMGLERNGDMNPIMADRPLMRNWESIDRNDMQPLILNSSTVSARTFNYYLCKMLRDNPVDQVFDVANSEGEQTLFVTAGRDLQRKQMVVKIINLSEQPQAFELKTDKNFKNRQTEVLTLTATPDQRVTPLTPDAVSTVTTTTTVSKGDKITLPGNAFVIYRISL